MNDSQIPTTAKVIAILAIIFASLGLVSNLTGLAGLAFWRTVADVGFEFSEMPSELPMRFVRSGMVVGIVSTIGGLVVSSVGLAGGIALLKRRQWALPAMNVYAIFTIVVAVVSYIGSLAFTGRIMDTVGRMSTGEFDPRMIDGVRSLSLGIGGFFGFFGVLLTSAFPVVVLVLLNRGQVREYYRGQ